MEVCKMEERKIPIKESLLTSIGNYLSQRPYREVCQLIEQIRFEIEEDDKKMGVVPLNPFQK
jgi:hypothetical protein